MISKVVAFNVLQVHVFENRRLLQDRGILSRIFDTAATVRRQVGGDAGPVGDVLGGDAGG